MNRYEVEDLVLGLADIVKENQMLREEVARLRDVEREYSEYVSENLKHGEEQNALLLACLVRQSAERIEEHTAIKEDRL